MWCFGLAQQQAAGKAGTPGANAAAPSRFAFNMMAEEEEKPSNVKRGKDGHVALDLGGDFFSNPLKADKSAKCAFSSWPGVALSFRAAIWHDEVAERGGCSRRASGLNWV